MAIRYKDPEHAGKRDDGDRQDLRKSGKSENAERGPHEKHRAMSEMAAEVDEVTAHSRPEGRKQSITIRFDKEIVEYFQSTGQKWQTRMNDVLLSYVQDRKALD